MAELPSASTTVDDEAGAYAGGTGYIVVAACVRKNADTKPRVYASAKGVLSLHEYSPGADYVALHIEKTRKPVIFVGLPIATAGAVVGLDVDDVDGTSVVTVTAAAGGIIEEVDAIVTVVRGGTVGTHPVELDISMDGGLTRRRVRVGTASTYTVPYFGIVLNFAAGTLLAGDRFTFRTTAPRWDTDDVAALRLALAQQMRIARSVLVVGDLQDVTEATAVVTAMNAYETENQRFTLARVQVRDALSSETKAEHVSAMDDEFGAIAAQRRIDIALGRARKLSPITGWSLRRPAAWAASIREYEHDIHIPNWRKADGPLDGWSLEDSDNAIVEYDERVDGGALAAGFTCLRTWGNGPIGTFVAMSLTRAAEGSLLSRTHNMYVANLACSINQAETEMAVGQSLVLNADGTATEASLTIIEERVNTALENELIKPGLEGQRASSAVWRASRNDVLNQPGAELTGVMNLLQNGTLERIATRVRIQTAGA